MKKKRIFWKLFFFQKDSRNLLGKRKTFLKKQQPWKGRPWTVFIVTEFYYVVAAKLSFWYRRSVFNITSKEKKRVLGQKKKKTWNTAHPVLCNLLWCKDLPRPPMFNPIIFLRPKSSCHTESYCKRSPFSSWVEVSLGSHNMRLWIWLLLYLTASSLIWL